MCIQAGLEPTQGQTGRRVWTAGRPADCQPGREDAVTPQGAVLQSGRRVGAQVRMS